MEITCSSSPMTKSTWKPEGRSTGAIKYRVWMSQFPGPKAGLDKWRLSNARLGTHDHTNVSTAAASHIDVFTHRIWGIITKAFSQEVFASWVSFTLRIPTAKSLRIHTWSCANGKWTFLNNCSFTYIFSLNLQNDPVSHKSLSTFKAQIVQECSIETRRWLLSPVSLDSKAPFLPHIDHC